MPIRKQHRRIHYASGLISLVLLPILCILSLKNDRAFVDYNAVLIKTWDGQGSYFNTDSVAEFLNSKKYDVVTLTGDNDADRMKLDLTEMHIQNLIAIKDSVRGVRFHFGEKSEYWTFIRALDILFIAHARFYLPYKNDIWFANPRPPKPMNFKPRPFLSCGKFEYYNEVGQPISWKEIANLGKKYFLPIVAFFLMLFFTFRAARNDWKRTH